MTLGLPVSLLHKPSSKLIHKHELTAESDLDDEQSVKCCPTPRKLAD